MTNIRGLTSDVRTSVPGIAPGVGARTGRFQDARDDGASSSAVRAAATAVGGGAGAGFFFLFFVAALDTRGVYLRPRWGVAVAAAERKVRSVSGRRPEPRGYG